jgi:uncharacterized HAD superfamily protein
MKHPKRIGFDLDGVLCENPEGFDIATSTDDEIFMMYRDAVPLWENIQVLNRIHRDTEAYVYIYTARDERWRPVTEEWLKKHRIKYDALVMNKLWLSYYVGDEAFNVSQLSRLELLLKEEK